MGTVWLNFSFCAQHQKKIPFRGQASSRQFSKKIFFLFQDSSSGYGGCVPQRVAACDGKCLGEDLNVFVKKDLWVQIQKQSYGFPDRKAFYFRFYSRDLIESLVGPGIVDWESAEGVCVAGKGFFKSNTPLNGLFKMCFLQKKSLPLFFRIFPFIFSWVE